MAVDPIEPDDEYVSFLPLAWIGEQMIAVACGLQAGFTFSFPEDAATQRADLREIGPRRDVQPAADLGDDALRGAGAHRRRRLAQARRSSAGRLRHRGPRRRPRGCAGDAVGLALRVAHRLADGRGPAPGARPARALAPAPRLHRRRAARARRLPLLPRDRRQPQADLRPDRDLRHRRHCTATTTSGSTPWASRFPGPRCGSPRAARSCSARRPCSRGYYRNEAATARLH